MSDKKSSDSNGGVSVLSLLGIVFVTLKLLGVSEVATWSWWAVTAPFWIGILLFLIIAIVVVLVAAVKGKIK